MDILTTTKPKLHFGQSNASANDANNLYLYIFLNLMPVRASARTVIIHKMHKSQHIHTLQLQEHVKRIELKIKEKGAIGVEA